MKRYFFSFVLVLAGMFAACQQPTTVQSQVTENVELAVFEKYIADKQGAQLLDVRTPDEFKNGHIKGALNLDIYDADFDAKLAKLDHDKPVLVYCKSGGRSGQAAEKMKTMGFKEVYNLKGGMLAWSNAGKAVETAGSTAPAGGLTNEAYLKKVAEYPLVLVDFNAVWCGPCKKMMPVIEKITADQAGRLTLLKIDADENPVLMREKQIEGIPYFEIYKNGKLVWSYMGMTDEATIVQQLQ